MTEDAPTPSAKPYASWSGLGFGLIALGFSLWVLFSGDVFSNFVDPPKDDPLLIVALVNGILGTLAGVIALARREPKRLAILALSISVIAIVAKFFLIAVAIGVVLVVCVGALGGM